MRTLPTTEGCVSPIWKIWTEALLDLVFPRRCAGCGRMGTWLCPDCTSTLPRIEPPVCRHCGLPSRELQICSACWQQKSHGIRTPYYFEGTLRAMVHRLKYRRARHLAEPLGLLMVDFLKTRPFPDVDAVVPVPLYPTRLKERGYNQSVLLAQVISTHIGIPVAEDCLERVRDTPAQMSLPARERAANVRGAFRPLNRQLAGGAVLLIDDVCTTGATLEACAAALKRSRTKEVWALALTRAVSSPDRPHATKTS